MNVRPQNDQGGSNSDKKLRKRPRTERSYAESSRSKDTPLAHSAAAERHLATYGVILDNFKGEEYVSSRSLELCQKLRARVEGEKFLPRVGYPFAKLNEVMSRLGSRNEARVVRDLTPLLVPSPENLAFSGVEGIDHVGEDIEGNWSSVQTMGGPTPRPDIAVGLCPEAFTRAEMAKLDQHKSWATPTSFTPHMFFPFLVCEVKCSNQSVNRASRQAGHSAAMAVNAIWQLYRSALEAGLRDGASSASIDDPSGEGCIENRMEEDVSNETGDHAGDRPGSRTGHHGKATDIAEATWKSLKGLNGEILVFSVAHDNENVELYGHYPMFRDGDVRPSIYRYLINSLSFVGETQERTRQIRDFVLNLYLVFSKTHLERIQRALSMMPGPRIAILDTPGQKFASKEAPSAQSDSQSREERLKLQITEMQSAAQKRDQERDQQIASMQADRVKMQAQMSQLMELVKQAVAKTAG